MGIPVKVESPGVGNNLQSHVGTGDVIFTLREPVSFNVLRLYLNPLNLISYLTQREGPLSAVTGFDGMGNIRLNERFNSSSISDRYYKRYKAEEPDWPDMQINMLAHHVGTVQKLPQLTLYNSHITSPLILILKSVNSPLPIILYFLVI